MKTITKRQSDILQFICQYKADRGYAPSVREIGEAVGLKSTSSIHRQLDVLETRGLLRRNPGVSRAIVLTEGDEDVTSENG